MNFSTQEENSRLRETRTGSEEIFDGIVLHVKRDTVRLPNGHSAIRELIRHIGAVCVIPVLDNGDVIMERQYRYPIDRVILEIPAGKLDAAGEDRLSAAQRELREETGYTADEWINIGDFHAAPAYSDEYITMYMARGLRRGDRHLDEDEFLDVHTVPLKELVEEVMAGRISDAKTQVCILKAARLLGI
ncbi:MAG: NUDIX hydrolase [Clostridia bacterium]|nr:NUDIX hydrolase [Clostridia bacterium]MBR4576553.1 NUDIX hydrolase [Clostridia bacterium]